MKHGKSNFGYIKCGFQKETKTIHLKFLKSDVSTLDVYLVELPKRKTLVM